MDFGLLPQEIHEHIVLFLELSDILSCCLVNTNWRNAINSNKIWNHLCLSKYDMEKGDCEFITDRHMVTPEFTIPKNQFSRLTDLCDWRIRFMQETHISKNWRCGRYVPEFVTCTNETVESDGNIIVIPNTPMRMFTPWDIEDGSVLIKNIVPYSLRNMLASFFKLCKSKIVITQCTLLQIFSKTKENNFVLEHRFLFNRPYEESSKIPDIYDLSEWYDTNVGLYPCDVTMCCDHDGRFFVGVLLEGNLNRAVLHVWDIINGRKLKEQTLPNVNHNINDIRFTLHSSKLYLFLQVEINNIKCTQIYCFDLLTLSYTKLLIHFDYILPLVFVRDPYLLVADTTRTSVSFRRIFDGEIVYKISSDHYLNLMTVHFASSLVIICGGSSRLAHSVTIVFDTKTLKTAYQFHVDFIIINLKLIRKELMLISGPREFGLWDITVGTRLYTLNEVSYRQVVWANNNFSKILLETENNELFLLHFW